MSDDRSDLDERSLWSPNPADPRPAEEAEEAPLRDEDELPSTSGGQARGGNPDALVSYLRSIAGTPILSREAQYELADRLEAEREAFLAAVYAIPATRSGRPDTLLQFAEALLGALRRAAFGAGAGAWPDEREVGRQARELLAAVDGDPVVRIPDEFVMLARIFGTLGGLFQHYRPRIDFARHLEPVLGALAPRNEGTQRSWHHASR
jgi:hypothetical protein